MGDIPAESRQTALFPPPTRHLSPIKQYKKATVTKSPSIRQRHSNVSSALSSFQSFSFVSKFDFRYLSPFDAFMFPIELSSICITVNAISIAIHLPSKHFRVSTDSTSWSSIMSRCCYRWRHCHHPRE